MRIGVATVVFDDEWQVESRNLHARLQLMGEILGAADRHRAALLVLPAGFFVVSREKDRDDIVKRARRSLSGTRTAVLWGVDVRIADGIGKAGQRDRDPVLPFYLYLRDASGQTRSPNFQRCCAFHFVWHERQLSARDDRDDRDGSRILLLDRIPRCASGKAA